VKPLVIGLGNDWRGDDALGLLAARRLCASLNGHADVREARPDAAALLDAWRGRDVVVLLDAMRSGAAPGTIRRFDAAAAPLPAAWDGGSTHAFGAAQAIELGRALHELPARVIVYGVEAGPVEAGAGLSREVERSLDEIERLVAEEVARA
jgi:hydrogenase maturation protease